MKTKICCRCLTEIKTGYGNFNRCLILAKQLKKNNIETIFLIDDNNKIINELKHNKILYSIIPKNYTKNNEHFFILNFLKKMKLDTIIIDMRQYGEFLSKILNQNNKQIILIDDLWSKRIYSDLFFNTTNVFNFEDYKIMNNSSQIFLGLKYYPLNKEFIKYRKNYSKIKNKNILNLVITMGGSDPNDLTYELLKIVKNIDRINICVIVGPLYTNLKKLKTLIQKRKNITIINSPKNFVKELSKADIALTSGGNTLFEAIALGIPTIVIPAFRHEILYAKEFSKQKCIINLGFHQKNKKKIQYTLNKMITDIKLRKELSRSTSKIIDGNGLQRMSKIISKFLQ